MKPSILPVVGNYSDKLFTQNKTKQKTETVLRID